jgi:hypothetical protein
MRRRNLFLLAFSFLFLSQVGLSQEKFNDVRQQMADHLTAVKTSLRANDRQVAMGHFAAAKRVWEDDVKPMITEGVKTNSQFQEYFDRLAEVDGHFVSLAQELESGEVKQVESRVNAMIWAISHHPRGFKVPPPRYTAWDWVFGLGIGVGFCVFAAFFGLYLRRSYYRRYQKQGKETKGSKL